MHSFAFLIMGMSFGGYLWHCYSSTIEWAQGTQLAGPGYAVTAGLLLLLDCVCGCHGGAIED